MTRAFERFAGAVSAWLARAIAFVLALAFVLTWAATGPLFDFSDNWQLVINTGTTIVTFLMVFVLHNAASRDNAALHLKLDALVKADQHVPDRLIGAEAMAGHEIAAERERLREG